MNAQTLTLILTFCIITSFSEARPTATQPQAMESMKLNQTQQQNQGFDGCSYTVTIATNCDSFMHTRELIGLSFGDAYGNEVYVPSLDSRVFEQCSRDIYEIYGPCTYQICSLYLYRTGDVGWIPETVTVHNYLYDPPVTFYFNTYIPEGEYGFGFDHCHDV